MKKFKRIISIVFFAYVSIMFSVNIEASEMKKVMILTFPKDSIRESMTKNAIEALEKAGFKDNENISISIVHPEKPEIAAEQVKANQPDIVIDLNPGGQFIPLLQGLSVPVITGYGAEKYTDTNGNPKGNITGIHSKIQDMVYNSYKFLNKAAPIPLGKKAVFLNNAKFKLITQEESADALKRLNIPLKAIVEATAYEDWQDAIIKYNEDSEVGWILMGVWPFNKKDGSPIDRESEAKWLREHLKKPMVTYWEIGVQLGILCGFAIDLDEVGQQCGKMAVRILKGEAIQNVKAEYPYKNIVALNLKTAQFMGINFHLEAIRLANVIFKDYEGKDVIRK